MYVQNNDCMHEYHVMMIFFKVVEVQYADVGQVKTARTPFKPGDVENVVYSEVQENTTPGSY